MTYSPYSDPEEYTGPTGPREALPQTELLRIAKVTGCNMVTTTTHKEPQRSEERAHCLDIALTIVADRVLRDEISAQCNKRDVEAYDHTWPGDIRLQDAIRGMVHCLVHYLKDQAMISFLSSGCETSFDSVDWLIEITGLSKCVWDYHADGLMECMKEELHSLFDRAHKGWINDLAQEVADDEED